MAGAFPLNLFGICDGTETGGDGTDGTMGQTCFDLFNFGFGNKGAYGLTTDKPMSLK